MYRIALMPQREVGKRSLLAHTDEWQRFIDYLRTNRRQAFADAITAQLDLTKAVNIVTLTTSQSNTVLELAGVSC